MKRLPLLRGVWAGWATGAEPGAPAMTRTSHAFTESPSRAAAAPTRTFLPPWRPTGGRARAPYSPLGRGTGGGCHQHGQGADQQQAEGGIGRSDGYLV